MTGGLAAGLVTGLARGGARAGSRRRRGELLRHGLGNVAAETVGELTGHLELRELR